MVRRIRWPLSLLALALATCSPPAPPPPVAGTPPPPPPHIAPADAAFATAAAQSGLFALRISEIAVQRGGRQGIKDFAQTVVDTQTQSGQQLADIMRQKGLSPSEQLTPAQMRTVEALGQATEGRRFARQYFPALVRSQIGSLRQMDSYAGSGTDPELKGFAAQQVPLLRDQLARARQLPRQRGG